MQHEFTMTLKRSQFGEDVDLQISADYDPKNLTVTLCTAEIVDTNITPDGRLNTHVILDITGILTNAERAEIAEEAREHWKDATESHQAMLDDCRYDQECDRRVGL